MKTAILVTGHPRTYISTVQSLFENCVIPNNSDVFLSVWSHNEDGSEINISDIQDLYRPIAIDVSSPSDYESIKQPFVFLDRVDDCFRTNIRAYLSVKTNGIRHIERIRSQWYRVKRGIDLISSHRKYDVVLRTRFDIKFKHQLDMSIVDTSCSNYYIPTLLESVQQDHFVSCGLNTPVMTDHWCYGSWESMLKYGSIYDELLPMYRDENVPISNAEEMFAYFMLTRIGKEHYIDGAPYELVR
jgi:hypothetical protein